jgi:hypothetical protein
MELFLTINPSVELRYSCQVRLPPPPVLQMDGLNERIRILTPGNPSLRTLVRGWG